MSNLGLFPARGLIILVTRRPELSAILNCAGHDLNDLNDFGPPFSYTEVYTTQPSRKKKLKLRYSKLMSKLIGEPELKQTIDNLNKFIKHDHDCISVCDCVENCVCSGSFKKQKVTDKLQLELEGLKTENALRRQATKGRIVVDKFLKNDAKMRTYTGLSNKKLSIEINKAALLVRFKNAISTKVRRNFKASPKKTGPQRKLHSRIWVPRSPRTYRLIMTGASR